MTAVNETMRKFGYPRAAVAEHEHWVVLARPKQITLGSLVLACRDDVTAFADISAGAFAELGAVIGDVEANLRRIVDYEKINYLMLMMVDPNVHFHVIPRYAGSRSHEGIDYPDTSWPGPPDLRTGPELTPDGLAAVVDHLRTAWRRR